MKKVNAFILCAMLVQVAVSQSFEGYIKWKFSLTGMPASKKPEVSQPDNAEVQAGIAQMKAQLDDPNIKNNPQLKSQIEQTINMMESQSSGAAVGDNMMSRMMPKAMTVKMKGGNSSVAMEGGIMASRNLMIKGSEFVTSINDNNKTFTKLSTASKGKEAEFTVEKTAQTMKVIGFNCTKYIVKGADKRSGTKTTTFLWASTEIPGIDYAQLYKNASDGQSFFYKNVQGVPLKIETKMGEIAINIEAVEMKKTTIPDSEFTVPSGYKEKKSAY